MKAPNKLMKCKKGKKRKRKNEWIKDHGKHAIRYAIRRGNTVGKKESRDGRGMYSSDLCEFS